MRRRRRHRAWRVLALAGVALWLLAATNAVTIEIEGEHRLIRSNGIPAHPTGAFPNAGNPNRIAEQRYEWRVPLAPRRAERSTELTLGPFGVALNGVPFDPGAAEWWRGDPRSGWQVEALGPGVRLGIDESHAHVQPNGAYHYHGVPTGLLAELGADGSSMVQLGWAADGFPIYGPWGHVDAMDAASPLVPLDPSYRLQSGTRPDGEAGPGGAFDGRYVQDHRYVEGAGDLDACNGRQGVTPEFPRGTYAYYLTEAYPFVPRCFVGTPDASFRLPRGGGPPGGPPDGFPPRRGFPPDGGPAPHRPPWGGPEGGPPRHGP